MITSSKSSSVSEPATTEEDDSRTHSHSQKSNHEIEDQMTSTKDEEQQKEKLLKAISTAERLHHIVGQPKKIVFMLGVTNYLFVVWMLGFCPQFYWIYFIIKSPILLFIHFKNLRIKMKHYEMMDFCWIANATILLYLILAGCGALPPQTSGKIAFRIFFTVSIGPLAWAVVFLGNSVVFHSEPHMSSLFIHLSPIALMWSLRWHSSQVDNYFPGKFPASFDDDATLPQLWIPGVCFYLCWFVLFSIWMYCDGLSRPDRGFGTVYSHTKFEKTAKAIFGNISSEFALAIYLFGHALACCASMLLSILFYRYHVVMTLFGAAVGLTSVWNGAGLYASLFAKYDKIVMELLRQGHYPLLDKEGSSGKERL